MVLRIKRHSMIFFATPDWIPCNDFIRGRINYREYILVLKVDVHSASHRVVLRHSGFAIEVEGLDDLILVHIDDCFRFTALV